MNETGEFTASINRRSDAQSWKLIEPALADGFELRRMGHGIARYYTHGRAGDRRNGITISATAVKRMLRDRVLVSAGVDCYKLAP